MSEGGCCGGACRCAGGANEAQAPVASVNGIALAEADEAVSPGELLERAWGELLRQEAVRRGILPRRPVLAAPALDARDHEAIEAMLEEQVPLAQPSPGECRRYFEANRSRYAEGRQAHVRHILFAVTDGMDVDALARRAGLALQELKAGHGQDFGRMARELSNCPSAREGGDLGWIAPHDCAPELADALFHQKEPVQGLHPRLVHSRYGLHIVEVLDRREGREASFEAVQGRIGVELAQRSRATALHQYIRVLAGSARVEGIELEGAASPLVQ